MANPYCEKWSTDPAPMRGQLKTSPKLNGTDFWVVGEKLLKR